ncbi:MAG: cyclic nucleotide-binding domain-containing protein [Deltaproteobacteria bacterium]|nr:MAG: cyclic nucleotide-binding domain-containing protein [Deltaproteobacteria bacterium]
MATGLEELGITDDGEPTPIGRVEEDARPGGATTEEAPSEDVEALLGKMPLFDGLLPAHLRRIAALSEIVDVPKGEAVFHHGDPGDGLYLVLDGAIRISRNVSGMGEEALAILRPGQYFGEMSIVDDAPRSADAIAHEPSRLLRLPKDDLRDLMFVDRELAYELLWRFVRTLSSRLRESNDRLLMLTVSSKF